MKYKKAFSILIVLSSFLIPNLFMDPIYNSGDDTHLMYLLGGGYGLPPDNLLHYNYGWHPLLGWVVMSMFELFPQLNWYTLFLLFLHASAFIIIFYILLNKFTWRFALFIYFIVFFFVEIRNLLTLNYTSTSWVLAFSGYLLLLEYNKGRRGHLRLIVSFLFVVISFMLRFHSAAAVTVFSIPFLFYGALRNYIVCLKFLLLMAVTVFLTNVAQKNLYIKYIPDWQKQENIRQSLIYSYNRPSDKDKSWDLIFKDSMEYSYYVNHFYFDDSLLSPQRIREIGRGLTRIRTFDRKEDLQVFYWFFIGVRVYLLVYLVGFFIVWRYGMLKTFVSQFAFTFLPVGAAYIYLILFLKITFSVHLGFQLILLLGFVYSLRPDKFPFNVMRASNKWYFLLMILPLAWMGKRILAENEVGRDSCAKCKCFLRELESKNDFLFVNLDSQLPLDYFSIWDTPYKFPIKNLITGVRTPTKYYNDKISRYKIHDLYLDMVDKENVYLLGEVIPGMNYIYKYRYGAIPAVDTVKLKMNCISAKKLYWSSRYPASLY